MSESPEPFSALQESAMTLHELFLAYVDAGFTRMEAFELTRSVLVAGLNGREK